MEGSWRVYTHGGRKATPLDTFNWAREAQERGAGEILLTSMVGDGTQQGFSVEMTARLADSVEIPVIASGGAGTVEHFVEVLGPGKADAALAASVFHFGTIPIPQLKSSLKAAGIAVRL